MSGNPYEIPNSFSQPGAGDNSKLLGEIKAQALTSLIVGIVSIFCCGILLGPFAIYRGAKAKRLIDESGVGQEHRGMATAGFIIGIVAMVLNVIGIVLYALGIALVMANQGR